jgi:hypothetical protein
MSPYCAMNLLDFGGVPPVEIDQNCTQYIDGEPAGKQTVSELSLRSPLSLVIEQLSVLSHPSQLVRSEDLIM